MRFILAVLVVLVSSSVTMAQSGTAIGPIKLVRTGWNCDCFAVVVDVPVVNPAGCHTADGYISEQSFPGYRTYYAAALTAFTSRKNVSVVVHDTLCFADRPRIIGINVFD